MGQLNTMTRTILAVALVIVFSCPGNHTIQAVLELE